MVAKKKSPHTLLLQWPQWNTHNSTPVEKTIHLSEDWKRHQDHMVEVLIRRWGHSTRSPPSGPLWYQLHHMGQLLVEEPLTGVHFPWGPPGKGEARHIWCASTVLLCNHLIKQKVLMTERLQGCFSALMAVSTLMCLLLVSQDKPRNGERYLSGSRDSEQL